MAHGIDTLVRAAEKARDEVEVVIVVVLLSGALLVFL